MWSGSIVALSAGLMVALAAPSAVADPSDITKRAAAAFDDGVERFKRADYQAAARAFLLADELVNSLARATDRLALHPQAPAHASAPATTPPAVEKAMATPPTASISADQSTSGDKHLSPTVFYAGLGASIVLAGITTWSS